MDAPPAISALSNAGMSRRSKSDPALHDVLKSNGFVIYAGQGRLSKTLFRISTMGNLTSQDIDRLLECFARLRR